MEKKDLISTTQAAKILGMSRVAVYKKVRKGELEAVRIGRSYAIDRKSLGPIYQETTSITRKQIDRTVDRVLAEYGDVLKRLGRD